MVKNIIRNAAELTMPALGAGIKVPDDLRNYNTDEFPHFSFFCGVQLNRMLLDRYSDWHNAEVVSKLTKSEMKTATWELLERKGFKKGDYV